MIKTAFLPAKNLLSRSMAKEELALRIEEMPLELTCREIIADQTADQQKSFAPKKVSFLLDENYFHVFQNHPFPELL